MKTETTAATAVEIVREQLAKGRAAAKCHPCGCFQNTVEALAASSLKDVLASELAASRHVFAPRKYECLGCAECFPAIAANAVSDTLAQPAGLELCASDPPSERRGWPPLPGNYHVIRYGASVAVCTLNSFELAEKLAVSPPEGLAIAGTMQTENLGIERLTRNIIANPNIRFLLLCGEDTRQAIGHLPGQSLESLFREGVDDRQRIRGAQGKRPVLKNVTGEQIARFAGQIELVSMIGQRDEQRIAGAIRDLADQRRPSFDGTAADVSVEVVEAKEPIRMVSDPSGFFVVYPDRARKQIVVEHYTNDGALHRIVEGISAGAIYTTIIERDLISRLDHAAYLGRELARALHALEHDEPYIQDRAPELGTRAEASCAGSPSCS